MHTAMGFCKRAVSGALAGIAGTAAMSAALGVSDAFGVMDKQPPRMIIEALLPDLDEAETNATAVVCHIGYGKLAGVGYTMVVAPEHRNAATGILYGAAVWAAGYEGWLPLLGILPPAHRDKPSRAWTMFLAHIIYGAVLGRTAGRLSRAAAARAAKVEAKAANAAAKASAKASAGAGAKAKARGHGSAAATGVAGTLHTTRTASATPGHVRTHRTASADSPAGRHDRYEAP